MSAMHPHPDKLHIMTTYRRFVLEHKRKWGTFRGYMKRREYLQTYLHAKRQVLCKV